MIGVLSKARVHGHLRREPTGQLTWVKDYEDVRRPGGPESIPAVAAQPAQPDPTPRLAFLRRELRADVGRLWRMETVSTYKSKNYPVLAVREGMQNGMDAIRKAIAARQIPEGHFGVEVRDDRLVIEDNGVGMSSEDIDGKFLTLGGTGKADDPKAVGGFGVAKAVILGSSESGRWTLETRENVIRSEDLGRDIDPQDQRGPYRQGTRLTIYDPAPVDYSTATDVRNVLASSDVGRGIRVTMNGDDVVTLYPRGRGKPVIYRTDPTWPAGTDAQITRYRRPGQTGRMVVRLNGLYQFHEPFYETVGADYVVDLQVTARPGTPEYPFTKGRDGLIGDAERAFHAIKRQIEQESVSSKTEEEWDTVDYGDPTRAEARDDAQAALADFLDDPEIVRALEEARKAMLDTVRTPKTSTGATGSGSLVGKLLDALGGPHMPAAGGIAGAGTGEARRYMTSAEAGGRTAVEENPIQRDWALKRNKVDYKKKPNLKRDLPILLVWDSILTGIARESGLDALRWKPGLVYSGTALGLQETKAGADKDIIYVNPDRPELAPKARKNVRTAVAILYNTACHELAHHVKGGGHFESWASVRENLFDRSAHLLPQLEDVARNLWREARPKGRPVAASTAPNRPTERKRRAHRERLAHMRAVQVGLWGQAEQQSLF